ncbi:hypothetical protein ABI59_19505 [Acidobacteria bacterium Mor1]|nr:hypothetical protein ABI59_19505 [Acidobacteria bacterium Mor1]
MLAIVIGLTIPTTSALAGDWNQWRGPQRNGVSPESGIPGSWTPGPGGNGNVVWRQATDVNRTSETSSGARDSGSVVVVGTRTAEPRVFFMHSMTARQTSRMIALDDRNGGFLWDYVTQVYGGNGFSICPNHQGASTPYVDLAGRRIYYGTKEGRLQALDFDGNLVWRRLTQGNTPGEDPNAFGVTIHNCGNGSPLLRDGRLIFHLSAHYGEPENRPKVVALNPDTGGTLWTYAPTYRRGLLHGSWSIPVDGVSSDGVPRVYFQLADGAVRGIRASTGVEDWYHEDDSGFDRTKSANSHPDGIGSEGVASPVYNPAGPFEVAGGAIYVSAGEDPSHPRNTPVGTGRIWKLDARTGQEIWHYPSSNNDLGNVIAAVAISGYRLYVGDTLGYLHCVDIRTGQRLWRQLLGGGEIWASATVADGKVYIGTQDGDFFILADSDTFTVLDEDNVGAAIASSVAVAGGAFYVKSDDYVWKVSTSGGGGGDPPAAPNGVEVR